MFENKASVIGFCCRVRFVWQGGNSSFNLSQPCKLCRLPAVGTPRDVLPWFWRSLGGELLIVDSHFLPLRPTLHWYCCWLRPRRTSKLASASVVLGGGGVTTRTLTWSSTLPLTLAHSPCLSLSDLPSLISWAAAVCQEEEGRDSIIIITATTRLSAAAEQGFSSINPTSPKGWNAAFETRWKPLVLFAAFSFDWELRKT